MDKSHINFAVGTYTVLGGEGLLTFSLHPSTLTAQRHGCLKVDNPSFLCISPSGKHIYAVGESGENSTVHHATVGEGLTLAAAESVTAGHDPCHILWLSERTICVSSYSGGAVELYDVSDSDSGTLSERAQTLTFHESGTSPRQQSSHIHFCAIAPDGDFLVADDLGGDCLHSLKITRRPDGTARLSHYGTVRVHQQAGPRHICFSADTRHAYLITELSDEVMTFDYSHGTLRLKQCATAAPEPAHASAHIMVHPSGKWLYASVRRASDGIAVYSIGSDGLLQPVGYTHTGQHPRHFAITPDGALLLCACRDSDTIEIYRVSPTDGTLTDTRQRIHVAKPVCIQFFK